MKRKKTFKGYRQIEVASARQVKEERKKNGLPSKYAAKRLRPPTTTNSPGNLP